MDDEYNQRAIDEYTAIEERELALENMQWAISNALLDENAKACLNEIVREIDADWARWKHRKDDNKKLSDKQCAYLVGLELGYSFDLTERQAAKLLAQTLRKRLTA